MPSSQAHITARMDHATRDWIDQHAESLGVSMGTVLREAIEHYRADVEENRAGSPEPAPAKSDHKNQGERRMPRPKKNPAANLARPTGKGVLVDRAECHVCHVLVRVDEGPALAEHVAHRSVRERGEYKFCDGSGQPPTGPVVHGAVLDRRF